MAANAKTSPAASTISSKEIWTHLVEADDPEIFLPFEGGSRMKLQYDVVASVVKNLRCLHEQTAREILLDSLIPDSNLRFHPGADGLPIHLSAEFGLVDTSLRLFVENLKKSGEVFAFAWDVDWTLHGLQG